MKVLFDANVVLDFILERTPFHESAIALVSKVENGLIEGYICANSVTTIEYIVAKDTSRLTARKAIKHVMAIFKIAEVNRETLDLALNSPFSDFEDAVIYQSGLGVGVEAVVTRDAKGFKKSEIPVYSPEALYALILEVSENEKDNGRIT